jgi:hypothetical protein
MNLIENNKTKYSLSQFVEQFYNIKLLPYQKKLLDIFSKVDKESIKFQYTRSNRKLINYIRLLTYLMFMKENETIAILSPNGNKVMNRDEFVDWLENEYWRN